jgi:DNA-binding FadR family transcriptional regulator
MDCASSISPITKTNGGHHLVRIFTDRWIGKINMILFCGQAIALHLDGRRRNVLVSNMQKRETQTAIETAATRLRAIILDSEEGEFLGSEEALIARLGCARSTVKQVARLLEREGLLRVRRGINGGYFGARPDAGTIEATVSAYLETLDMDPQDVTIMASALWLEAMRKAARAPEERILALTTPLKKRLKAISDHATYDEVRALEMDTQAAVFDLAKSNYIKLIFDINIAFSRRAFVVPGIEESYEGHDAFVRTWREAKLLELNALVEGDRELAVVAGRYSRKVWHRRVRSRYFRRRTEDD